MQLFDILRLLLEFSDLGLHPDDRLDRLQVGCLGTDGIGFAVKLLDDKIEPSPVGRLCPVTRAWTWSRWLSSRTISSFISARSIINAISCMSLFSSGSVPPSSCFIRSASLSLYSSITAPRRLHTTARSSLKRSQSVPEVPQQRLAFERAHPEHLFEGIEHGG